MEINLTEILIALVGIVFTGVIIPLVLTVLIGGQIGSRMGAFKLPDIFIKRTTAVIVMFVGVRILLKLSILI